MNLREHLGKVAVILDGGGYSGAYSFGSYEALWDFGIQPEFYHGVSIGGLQAAKIVEQDGNPKELKERWYEMESLGKSYLFKRWMMPFRVFRQSFFDNTNLQTMVDRLDFVKIVNSKLTLEVATRREMAKKQRLFANHNADIMKNPRILRDAILASMSIMGIFDPVEIQGEPYSDGLNFDLNSAIRAECTTIFILGNSPSKIPYKKERAFARLMKGSHGPISNANADRIRAVRRGNRVVQTFPRINREFKEEVGKLNEELSGEYRKLADLDELNMIERWIVRDKIKKIKEKVSSIMTHLDRTTAEIRELMQKQEDDVAREHPVLLYNILPTKNIPTIGTSTFSRRRKDITRSMAHTYELCLQILQKEFSS